MKKKRRPISITVIAWLLIIGSGISFITTTFRLHPGPFTYYVHYGSAYAALLINIISGIGMLKGKNWARFLYAIIGIILAAINLATLPIPINAITLSGLAIFVLIVILLFLPQANEYFTADKSTSDIFVQPPKDITDSTINPINASNVQNEVTGWVYPKCNEKSEEMQKELENRKMNQMQKVVLYMGIAITVLMVLFPPWTPAYKVQSSYDPNQVSTIEEPTHYRFIVLPHHIPGRLPIKYAHLDIVRLCIQILAVGVVTAGLILILNGKKMPRINLVKLKKLAVFITIVLAVLTIGITIILKIISMKKLIPLSPSAQLEVKIAQKEPADGLTPINLELNYAGTIYLHEEESLKTSDITAVYLTKDQMGRLAIGVIVNKEGRNHLREMTSANVGKYAVIFVNGKAVSAPMIGSPINANKFMIPGSKETIDETFQELTQK